MSKQTMNNKQILRRFKEDIEDKDWSEMDEEKLREEKQTIKDHYDEFKSQLEILRRDYELEKRKYEIMLNGDNLKKINPSYKYETQDEFFELRKRKHEIEWDNKRDRMETEQDQYEQMLEALEYNMDVINEELGE